jgi:hypothetical protein
LAALIKKKVKILMEKFLKAPKRADQETSLNRMKYHLRFKTYDGMFI